MSSYRWQSLEGKQVTVKCYFWELSETGTAYVTDVHLWNYAYERWDYIRDHAWLYKRACWKTLKPGTCITFEARANHYISAHSNERKLNFRGITSVHCGEDYA